MVKPMIFLISELELFFSGLAEEIRFLNIIFWRISFFCSEWRSELLKFSPPIIGYFYLLSLWLFPRFLRCKSCFSQELRTSFDHSIILFFTVYNIKFSRVYRFWIKWKKAILLPGIIFMVDLQNNLFLSKMLMISHSNYAKLVAQSNYACRRTRKCWISLTFFLNLI